MLEEPKRELGLLLTLVLPVTLLIWIAGALPVSARPVAATPLPPVSGSDGFGGVCYSHYYGPNDRPYLPLVRNLGVTHDRIDFRWDRIREAGSYESYDSVVNDVASYGVDLIGILMATPPNFRKPGCSIGASVAPGVRTADAERPMGWYAPETDRFLALSSALADSDPGACPPNGLYNTWSPTNFNGNVWAEFVYNTVTHFKSRVRVWEIWNEPEWSWFWLGTDAEYAQLLKVGYRAAKLADPDATVLFGGLHYWADPTFYERVLDIINDDPQAPAHNYFFDAMSVHLYGRSSTTYDIVKSIQSRMRLYATDHPVWLTETGVPVYDGDYPGARTEYSATEVEQAAFLIQSYANARAAGVQRYHWFRVHDHDMEEHFGLTHDETYLRPSYVAYQVASTYLISPALVTNVNHLGGTVRRVTFWGTPWGKVSVVWNTISTTLEFGYGATLPSATRVDRRGVTQPLTPVGGTYTLTLPGATAHLVDAPTDYFIGGEPYLVIESDTVPPTASIQPVPVKTYSYTVQVAWSGSDDAAGIWMYDVQVKEGGEAWRDWQSSTTTTSASYAGASHNQTVCFRVRAWDRAGNPGSWTDGSACTTFVLERAVHLVVGAVAGASDDGLSSADVVTLTNVSFRLVNAAFTDVVSPGAGASWELSATLGCGYHRLIVTPEGWWKPPPGWLPAYLPVHIEPGMGRLEIAIPQVTLMPHAFSRWLPIVLARSG
ncbi:MAG: hypothetical protein GX620_10005 [Chloroflexi bacterium]|nr:hypothetical protein [Chloroflexota bacterium]